MQATTIALTVRSGRVDASGPPRATFGDKETSDAPHAPDGAWAEWDWDGKRLTVRNDRYGFYPLFYHASADHMVVSDSLLALLRHGVGPDLDHTALAVFLRLGFFLGEQTALRTVRALPPGCELRWTRSGVVIESSPPAATKPYVSTRRAAIRAYGELFQSAVERQLADSGERMLVPLSGGRDSRHVLLALHKAGRPPEACVTVRHFPPKADEDARIAARLTAALGVPHIVLEQDTDRFCAEQRKNLLTHFSADEHAWMLPLSDHMREGSYSDVWDGIGGDVLSAGLFLEEALLGLFEAGQIDALAERILPPEGYLPDMLTPRCYRLWSRAAALEALTVELGRHERASNPVGQFYFWNRTRREIAVGSWCLLGPFAHVRAPFLAAEVYDFLCSLPASYLLDRTFHSEAIAARYPEHADLPYERGDAARTVERRPELARFALRTARLGHWRKDRSPVVRRSFLLPRLARGLIDRRYGTELIEALRRAIYLDQLHGELVAA